MSRPTNCINCGAVLTSWKCEYCGTDYRQNECESQQRDDKEKLIEITTFESDKKVYISQEYLEKLAPDGVLIIDCDKGIKGIDYD